MNVLHVEDEGAWFSDRIEPLLKKLGAGEIYHAKNKAAALNLLASEDIDYAMVDLAIPSETDQGVPDVSHGISLVTTIRDLYSGTPILVLTGQSREAAAETLEEDDDFAIFWDGKRKPLVKMRNKRDLDKALELVGSAINALAELNQIAIDAPGVPLDFRQKRIIQLFGRANDAIAAKVRRLNGGLSSSLVLAVTLVNKSGNEFFHALAKIDDKENVDVEVSNYENIKQLPVGRIPTYLDQYFAGCGTLKGVFFQLATDYTSDFFKVLQASDEAASELVDKVRGSFGNWEQQKEIKDVTLGELRRCFCSDEKLEAKALPYLAGIDIEEVESKLVKVNYSVQHCDLHGMNILVSDQNEPLIIDYGDIAVSPSVIDPITLELSCYFHPETRDSVTLPSEAVAVLLDDEKYLEYVSCPQAMAKLRAWSRDNGLLSSDIAAVVYAYAVRQLTHEGTDKELALSLIEVAIAALS